jgi:hypothetical protein
MEKVRKFDLKSRKPIQKERKKERKKACFLLVEMQKRLISEYILIFFS